MSRDDDWRDKPDTPEINVDSMGIPILNEVVEEDFADTMDPHSQHNDLGLNLPRHDLLLVALRQQLKSELQIELAAMIDQIAVTIAGEISHKLEDELRDQLTKSMEGRLSELLDKSLRRDSGEWNVK